MENLFLVYGNTHYTFEKLLNDLNNKMTFSNYVYSKHNRPYEIFLSIIHSLIYEYRIEVLDGDFSIDEIFELGVEIEKIKEKKIVKKPIQLSTVDELLKKIQSVQDWQLTLFTSGTIGRPKSISQSFTNLTRNVKTGNRFKDDTWAFAYNPTHMAGFQVFFQALLNMNPIIYIFDQPFANIPQLLCNYKVTNISATPTYYRNVIPFLKNNVYPFVNYVTLGGEKYDPLLEKDLKQLFPNAKIRNIYATTETGTLFSSDGEVFFIPKSLRKYVKFSDENEILIHESLLGNSEALLLNDGWYATGDFVEKIDDYHFKFISRKSEMINVGGYKVNPTEVENVLLNISGVKDVVVKSRKNSVTGEIIVAEVIKKPEVDAKELKRTIKKYASTHLAEWKVPRIITFVDEIQIARSGKKVRR